MFFTDWQVDRLPYAGIGEIPSCGKKGQGASPLIISVSKAAGHSLRRSPDDLRRDV